MKTKRNSAPEDSKKTDAVKFTRRLRSVSSRVTSAQNVKDDLKEDLVSVACKKKKPEVGGLNERHSISEQIEQSNEKDALLDRNNKTKKNKIKGQQQQNIEEVSVPASNSEIVQDKVSIAEKDKRTKSTIKATKDRLQHSEIIETSKPTLHSKPSDHQIHNKPADKNYVAINITPTKIKFKDRPRQKVLRSCKAVTPEHSGPLIEKDIDPKSNEGKINQIVGNSSKSVKIVEVISQNALIADTDNKTNPKKNIEDNQQKKTSLNAKESVIVSSEKSLRVVENVKLRSRKRKTIVHQPSSVITDEHSSFSKTDETSVVSRDKEPASKKTKSNQQQRQNELKSSEPALISEHSGHPSKSEALLVRKDNKSKSKNIPKQKDRTANESSVIFAVQKSTDTEKTANVESECADIQTTIGVEKSVNEEVRTTNAKSTERLPESVQNTLDIPPLAKKFIDGKQFYGKIPPSKVITSLKLHPYVMIRNVEIEICRKPMEDLIAAKQKIAASKNEPENDIPIESETQLSSSEVLNIEILDHNRNPELDSNLMKIDTCTENSESKNDCASDSNATPGSTSGAISIENMSIGCEINVTNNSTNIMDELVDELADNLLKTIDDAVNEIDSANTVSEFGGAVSPSSDFMSGVNNLIDEVLSENKVSESVNKDLSNEPESNDLKSTQSNNSSKKDVKCVYDFSDSSSASEHENKCTGSSPERPETEKCDTKCHNDEIHDFAVLPKSSASWVAANVNSEVKESAAEKPPYLGEEIVNYFDRKHIDNRTRAQILQFIKDFDFVSEKTHDYASGLLKREDEQLVDLLSFSRSHENPATFFSSSITSKKAREVVSDCVEQIIRCVTWAMSWSPTDKKSESGEFFVPLQVVLQHAHIENFFNQIQDYEISKVYAESYAFFLNFIVNKSKCSLTPHNRDSIEKIRLILHEVISCKEIATVESINSNNLVTQHPQILKRARELLLIEGNFKDDETLFVFQYLHAYLRLELRKPTWVFKDADFYEYENAVDLEYCKVMVVYNNCKYLKRFQTVIWRGEALQLVDRFVCGGRNISSGNLFRDALYKKFASQINDDKFINSYYQDDGGKLKAVGHSKKIQTDVEPEVQVPEKKTVRTVGIQCSFQITLKANNNLPLTDYTVNLDKGVKSAFVLVPTRNAENKGASAPTFVDAGVDPIVIPKRHVQAQTSLAIINRFKLKEQGTQTEGETPDEPRETASQREIASESEIQIESEFHAEVQMENQFHAVKSESGNLNAMESGYLNRKNVTKPSSIKSVQHALQCWPPTTDGIPLTMEETGFSRDIYYANYYKVFVEAQIKLRAKVIVDEIKARRKSLKSTEVSAIAKKYNWPVTNLLMHCCLSKEKS